MDTNDYIGSFAQENVTFRTQIVRNVSVGDNFMKTCIFITDKNLTADGIAGLVAIPGSTYKALTVTAEDFASLTTGLLQSWLVDLYSNGALFDTILVSLGAGTTVPTADELTAAYEAIKPYAYHKTVCIGTTDDAAPTTNADLSTTLIAQLIELCTVDKEVLSSAELLPYNAATAPTGTGDDPIYSVAKNKFAFMSCHQDATRNPALYSLGLALAQNNLSGTPVGNPMCRPSSNGITASGVDGTDLGRTIRSSLNSLGIQTFKYVGDNTGNVCAEGEKCMNGDIYAAQWILAYVTYMVKVAVAKLITGSRDFYKTEASYTKILEVLSRYLNLFGPRGSGRLENIMITAPSFDNLPDSDADELVIPSAWEATYKGIVNKVTITGTLYIEG